MWSNIHQIKIILATEEIGNQVHTFPVQNKENILVPQQEFHSIPRNRTSTNPSPFYSPKHDSMLKHDLYGIEDQWINL